ncbi:MAG TPA: hypothetical protein VKB52_05235 [Rhodanobacteraceae bacterium]|nr:hypothetical protein [Rhodanobacteraceae bacterium]
MEAIAHYPLLLGVFSLALLWLVSWLAASLFKAAGARTAAEHPAYGAVQGATLTLLGLLIGFTFSMSLSRYDQRKNLEEEEANAIGTEYLRVEFLPAGDATKAKELLKSYLDERLQFYATRDDDELSQIDARTAALQDELWSIVRKAASSQPTPVMGVVVTGMNDVLNSQGYTLAAWRNRIPHEAWWLMEAMAVCAIVLVAGLHKQAGISARLQPVLPIVVSLALFMIADIDSPRRGLIRVVPQNLQSLSQSLHPH